jgi:hypothetical protein
MNIQVNQLYFADISKAKEQREITACIRVERNAVYM